MEERVLKILEEINEAPTVFAQEFNPDIELVNGTESYTVEYDADKDEFVVEGPRIEKMLGYTNIETEKGFKFFQDFLKNNGIIDELEALGIEEGQTVRMYGLSFDYYKNYPVTTINNLDPSRLYELRMINENNIPSFLDTKIRYVNGMRQYVYDISSLVSIYHLYEHYHNY